MLKERPERPPATAEPVHDGLDRIGSVLNLGGAASAYSADESYIGDFPNAYLARAAVRQAWRLQRIRVGVAR